VQVKKSLEITLTTIHLGSVKRVVTLGFDGKDLAHDYLLKLGKSNQQGLQSILKRLKAIAERESIENQLTYRHVGEQVFEVKTTCGLRFYTFPDEVAGLGHQLIIATSGGKKGNKKEQNADIVKAKALRESYLAAKPQASFNLIPLPNEDQDHQA
jgi:hypothetical protein